MSARSPGDSSGPQRQVRHERPPWTMCWFCGELKESERFGLRALSAIWHFSLGAVLVTLDLRGQHPAHLLRMSGAWAGWKGEVDYDLAMCHQCVQEHRSALGAPPADLRTWVKEILLWKSRLIEHSLNVRARLRGYEDLEYFPACWFELVPTEAPVRLVRGLPMLELYRRGWRWPWRIRFPAGLLRASIVKHVDTGYDVGSGRRRLFEGFKEMAEPWIFGPETEETIELLARSVPAASDYAIYRYLKEIPTNRPEVQG